MNILNALFKTSLGKKGNMAVTGLILVGFVIGHLVGNLQIFLGPDAINAYAYKLHHVMPTEALWGIRAFLLVCIVIHRCAMHAFALFLSVIISALLAILFLQFSMQSLCNLPFWSCSFFCPM